MAIHWHPQSTRHPITRWLSRLITVALAVALALGLAAGLQGLQATAQAAPAARATRLPAEAIVVDIRLANIYGFSTNDKSYTVEGKLWLTYSAQLAQELRQKNIDPIKLVSFYNKIKPWDSELIRLNQTPETLSDGRRRSSYTFNGNFYADNVDFKQSPFGGLDLSVILQAEPTPLSTADEQQPIQLVAGEGELGSRININGYTLTGWQFKPIQRSRISRLEQSRSLSPSRLEFRVSYQTSFLAALVEWILPLIIVMSLTLFAPNICSTMGSERLAIPPVVLLTIVLMQQSYRESLPSLPYLTFLDVLYAYSYLVTLAIFVLFIRSSNLLDKAAHDQHAAVGRQIDRMDFMVQIGVLSGYALLVLSWFTAGPQAP
jgi:hypothetical protein